MTSLRKRSKKSISNVLASLYEADYYTVPVAAEEQAIYQTSGDVLADIERLEEMMREAAKKLEFERAAEIRDQIRELKKRT